MKTCHKEGTVLEAAWQAATPEQKTITATEETAAAKAEDIQPEKTADTSAYRADAKQYAADGNSVTIIGLNTGDVVIYRVVGD